MGIAGFIPSSVGFRSLQRPSSGLALQPHAFFSGMVESFGYRALVGYAKMMYNNNNNIVNTIIRGF